MPDFRHTLQDTDLDFLLRVARFWGVDLPTGSFSEALNALAVALSNQELASEVLQSLPEDVRAIWQKVLQAGKLPVSQFTRQAGEIRVLGEAKRKREKPDLHPVSPAEVLWYRALIGKGFFSTGQEPQEYVYVPDELIQFFGGQAQKTHQPAIQPAEDKDHAFITRTNGLLILSQLAALLAELRKNNDLPSSLKDPRPLRASFYLTLFHSMGLVHENGLVDPEKSRQFLEKSAGDALLFLYQHWLDSTTINDLRMLPGLVFEGSWSNDPLLPRKVLVDLLRQLDGSTWWSISSLIHEIQFNQPDFQRPAGDYDSWFIRRKSDNEYLRGFDAWDEVEGLLLRYLLHGPLHWLGVLELGSTGRGKPAASFKLSPLAAFMISAQAPELNPVPAKAIRITSEGKIHIPAGISPALHYQVARFCLLQKETYQGFLYQVTSSSLQNASEQGLKPTQLAALIRRAAPSTIPSKFFQMLERFEKHGSEAQLEKSTLLRVNDPALLETLRKDPRAANLLGEPLTGTIIKIKPGAETALVAILAELGYLAEIHLDV